MTNRNCQNCEKPIGPLEGTYLYYSRVVCKECMIKLDNQFQVPGSADDNIKTETPIAEEPLQAEEQLEQYNQEKFQTPVMEDKAATEQKKDSEKIKDNASPGEDDNKSAQQIVAESNVLTSKECETNPETEAVNQPSSKQESPIEIFEYIERTVRKQTGYIGRHWRGELSLATSFWINVILVDLFLKSVEVITGAFIHNPSTNTQLIIYNPFVIMILYPWQIMGLWRSCNRHIETTGKWFWARAAQVFIVLGFIATLSNLFSLWPL